MIVMLLAASASHLTQDAAFSSAQWIHQQQALSQAELRLQQLVKNLAVNPESDAYRQTGVDWTLEVLNTDTMAELSDLPLSIFRITAVGHAAQVRYVCKQIMQSTIVSMMQLLSVPLVFDELLGAG